MLSCLVFSKCACGYHTWVKYRLHITFPSIFTRNICYSIMWKSVLYLCHSIRPIAFCKYLGKYFWYLNWSWNTILWRSKKSIFLYSDPLGLFLVVVMNETMRESVSTFMFNAPKNWFWAKGMWFCAMCYCMQTMPLSSFLF